jgi:hypothetical protein
MMATNADIYGWFETLKRGAATVAGGERRDAERQQIQALSEAALNILESVVIDLNNLAFYASERHQKGE